MIVLEYVTSTPDGLHGGGGESLIFHITVCTDALPGHLTLRIFTYQIILVECTTSIVKWMLSPPFIVYLRLLDVIPPLWSI